MKVSVAAALAVALTLIVAAPASAEVIAEFSLNNYADAYSGPVNLETSDNGGPGSIDASSQADNLASPVKIVPMMTSGIEKWRLAPFGTDNPKLVTAISNGNDLGNAQDQGSYFSITIEAAAGYDLNLDSLSFRAARDDDNNDGGRRFFITSNLTTNDFDSSLAFYDGD